MRFIDDVQACIVTEGAVERSFAAEGRLFTKSRVSLSEAHCEHRTFVHFNSKGEKRQRERCEDLSVEEWVKMISLLDPIAPTPRYNLRPRQVQEVKVTDVTKGTVIEVQWITDGVPAWQECVVLEKVGKSKFSVYYSSNGT